MNQWEYRVVKVDSPKLLSSGHSNYDKHIMKNGKLEELGLQGWEMVNFQVVTWAAKNGDTLIVFKRQLNLD